MTPNERARALVTEARRAVPHPDSAPNVVNHIMTLARGVREADAEMREAVEAVGWNKIVREVITRHFAGNAAAPALQAQLDLWPPGQREIVQRVDRAAVFVPSRNEHVELVPDALTPAETVEAGRYLVAHGEDTIRRGNALIMLGELRAQDAAA